jgi:signal transduction histidine kinase
MVVDVVPAVVLGVVVEVLVVLGTIDEGPPLFIGACAAAMAGSLAWRRRYPLAVTAVVSAAVVLQAVVAEPATSIWSLVVLLVVGFSAGAYATPRSSVIAGALLVAAAYVTTWLDPTSGLGDRLFTAPILAGGPWLAGRLVQRHRVQARRLDAQNVELETRRAEDLRTATQQERARIARELHDVVAHGISVMVVQAGAAGLVIEAEPAAAREALEQIRSTGKTALVEMRRLLGVLRTDEQGLALTPQPGVDDVPALLGSLRATGLDVVPTVEGEPVPLSPGQDLTVYRIVQEALTNALKHSSATTAELTTTYEEATVQVRVRDRGALVADVPAGGHGLIGMRERIALYGGTLAAGPVEGGGWQVLARLPVEPASTGDRLMVGPR